MPNFMIPEIYLLLLLSGDGEGVGWNRFLYDDSIEDEGDNYDISNFTGMKAWRLFFPDPVTSGAHVTSHDATAGTWKPGMEISICPWHGGYAHMLAWRPLIGAIRCRKPFYCSSKGSRTNTVQMQLEHVWYSLPKRTVILNESRQWLFRFVAKQRSF